MAYSNNYSNKKKNSNWNNNNRNINGNRNNGNGSNKNNNNVNSYVGAPYNFVPFNETVIEVDADRMPVHDKVSEGLLTGEIDYTLIAKTDIIVDDGNGNFHRNLKGRYSIPGSTMRGLIRNNVQILGLSSFDDDIDDYRLMYRNVANGAEKRFYNDVLGAKQISISPESKPVGVLTNVKGGYIVKRGGEYYIYKTIIDKLASNLNAMNYYVLSERNVENNRAAYPFLTNHPEVMQHNIQKGFRKEESKGKVQYKGEKNASYIPGYYEVSYEVTNIKNISKLGEPGEFSNRGYLVATGPMNDKKALYVIPEIDEKKPPIEISAGDVNSFKVDFENKKNTLKRFKNTAFFNLPSQNNEFKPVFYVELDGKLYFGFTPRIRLFYEYSIKDGYKQDKCSFDYARSIFGCINGKTGYKSKVSFADAIAVSDCKLAGTAFPVLAGPKPTSYLDYIQQTDGSTTYNTSGFELRGVKQYWLHKNLVPIERSENQKITSSFNPLKAGVKFAGKVRFQNLTKDELGLLVWSIKLNDNSWMNVGKAKAYGYGAIAIADVKVKTLDLEKAYSFDVDLGDNPMVDVDATDLVEEYKKCVNAKLVGQKIDNLRAVKDFFAMKDSTRIPDNKNTRYMRLGDRNTDKEYQIRMSKKAPLKSVTEVIEGKQSKHL